MRDLPRHKRRCRGSWTSSDSSTEASDSSSGSEIKDLDSSKALDSREEEGEENLGLDPHKWILMKTPALMGAILLELPTSKPTTFLFSCFYVNRPY